MPPGMSRLGQCLRNARTRAGLTQNRVSELLGLGGGSTVSHFESGRTRPSGGTLRKLADFYGLDWDRLILMRAREPATRRLKSEAAPEAEPASGAAEAVDELSRQERRAARARGRQGSSRSRSVPVPGQAATLDRRPGSRPPTS